MRHLETIHSRLEQASIGRIRMLDKWPCCAGLLMDVVVLMQAIERLEGLLRSGQSNSAPRPPLPPSHRSPPAAVAPVMGFNPPSQSSANSSSKASASPPADQNSTNSSSQDAPEAQKSHNSGPNAAVSNHHECAQKTVGSADAAGDADDPVQAFKNLDAGKEALEGICNQIRVEDASAASGSEASHAAAQQPKPADGSAICESASPELNRFEQMLEQQREQMAAVESALRSLQHRPSLKPHLEASDQGAWGVSWPSGLCFLAGIAVGTGAVALFQHQQR